MDLNQRVAVRVAFEAKPGTQEPTMGFGRGALLWLIGISLPIISISSLPSSFY
jgi:hypothetical protein